MKRREFLVKSSSAFALVLTGCGGGSEPASAVTTGSAAPPPSTPAPIGVSTPTTGTSTTITKVTSLPEVVGGLPNLTLHASVSGKFPYMATVFPLQGVLPAAKTLDSPEDSTLRASVLSRWPDGSASVVVVAGIAEVAAGQRRQLSLRAAERSASALLASRIGQLVTDVTCDFGAIGKASITNFDQPERVWWANEALICARYRLPIGNSIEAIIDIHGFSSAHAFVEIVIENGKLDPATAIKSNPSTYPQPQTYTNATVSVNGTTIATVSSAWAGGTAHQAFRSWYCSAEVSSGVVTAVTNQSRLFGLEVTHDANYLQAHPLLFKPTSTAAYDFSTYTPVGTQFFGVSQKYGNDAYVPWTFGRNRWTGMGATSDSATIAYLPQWECSYVQTGDRDVRNAVIASGLALMSFPINYRSTNPSNNGNVPTHTELYGKRFASGFPITGSVPFANYARYEWDYAHEPAVGLLPFLCRPSPCFIELAQKVAAFNAMGSTTNIFTGSYATRGRAWCTRNLGFAIHVTPDVHPWKAPAKANLKDNVTFARTWETDPEQKLNVMFNMQPGMYQDQDGTTPGVQEKVWMHHFMAVVAHKIASGKLVATSDQADIDAFANWAVTQAVRYVNEATSGEWRFVGYVSTLGTTSGTTDGQIVSSIGSPSTWGQAQALNKTAPPPPLRGPLCGGADANWTGTQNDGNLEGGAGTSNNYPAAWWSTLVAAVERGVTGAPTAWNTVTANLTNLSTFLGNGGKDCRFHHYPRNI